VLCFACLRRALAWDDRGPAAPARGAGVLRLLLALLLAPPGAPGGGGADAGVTAAALSAATALVGAAPADGGRAAMAPLLTSGAPERGVAVMGWLLGVGYLGGGYRAQSPLLAMGLSSRARACPDGRRSEGGSGVRGRAGALARTAGGHPALFLRALHLLLQDARVCALVEAALRGHGAACWGDPAPPPAAGGADAGGPAAGSDAGGSHARASGEAAGIAGAAAGEGAGPMEGVEGPAGAQRRAAAAPGAGAAGGGGEPRCGEATPIAYCRCGGVLPIARAVTRGVEAQGLRRASTRACRLAACHPPATRLPPAWLLCSGVQQRASAPCLPNHIHGHGRRWQGAWQLLAALLACLAPPAPDPAASGPAAPLPAPDAAPGASPGGAPRAGDAQQNRDDQDRDTAGYCLRGAHPAGALPAAWGPYEVRALPAPPSCARFNSMAC